MSRHTGVACMSHIDALDYFIFKENFYEQIYILLNEGFIMVGLEKEEDIRHLELHIDYVKEYLEKAKKLISYRMIKHDQRKLNPIQFSAPQSTYSVLFNYIENMDNNVKGIQCHHPEDFKNGIWDMSLIDLIEMTCDWLADEKLSTGLTFQQYMSNNGSPNINPVVEKIIYNTFLQLSGNSTCSK